MDKQTIFNAVMGLITSTATGGGIYAWRKYKAETRKTNADARKGEVDAEKGEAEIRKLDLDTARAFREEFNVTVREFQEERRQIAVERAAEREQFKAELAAERAAHQEVVRRKEEHFNAELKKWERKLDEAMAATEAERKARQADRAEFQAAIQRCADESHKSQQEVGTIKGQLRGMKLQLELLAPLATQLNVIEAALARIEGSSDKRPSKDAAESEAR